MSALAGLANAAEIAPTVAAARSDAPVLQVRMVEGRDWDSVISGFDGVCQEQLYAFAAGRWPNVRLEPRLFEHKDRIVGGALVMVLGLPAGLAQIAICKWGPMLADTKSADAALLYGSMVDALSEEFAKRRGMMLSVLPHVSPQPINHDYRILRERGFQRGFPLPHPLRYLVNLRLTDEALRKSFQQTWRRQLAKAEKSDLTFEHGGPEQFETFKTLYDAMTGRKQFKDFSAFDTVDHLMRLEEPLRPEMFFVRHAGEIVAGAMIFKAGERAVYLYGATNDKALPLRAGYFLHWHIIRWLRDHTRADWYDLGGTDGFQGLHQFKRGMVGEAGVVHSVPPVTNYAVSMRARVFGNAAFVGREYANRFKRRLAASRNDGAKPDQPPPPLEDQFK